jgi:hypothetical protein
LQDCYTDFRLAPGGAASWLYVLHGSKVLLPFPFFPQEQPSPSVPSQSCLQDCYTEFRLAAQQGAAAAPMS